ncbi:hypothetical protein [Methylobacterium symbioticum]|uniref:Uncharacterized protein n=1 Tax=Methylobacterium symbioticum TaxID=2584084 RepID=A0A509EJP6_9HYPH|nr:hypothetical protein [Methylobacterium symbioticum]VUD73834.1 hypothetical protein MET9862_04454 [Methylobacterium symbioticum]
MSRLGLFLLAFALATAAFWFTMLTDPPRSEAGSRAEAPASDPGWAPPVRERFVPEELCGRFGACPR